MSELFGIFINDLGKIGGNLVLKILRYASCLKNEDYVRSCRRFLEIIELGCKMANEIYLDFYIGFCDVSTFLLNVSHWFLPFLFLSHIVFLISILSSGICDSGQILTSTK